MFWLEKYASVVSFLLILQIRSCFVYVDKWSHIMFIQHIVILYVDKSCSLLCVGAVFCTLINYNLWSFVYVDTLSCKLINHCLFSLGYVDTMYSLQNVLDHILYITPSFTWKYITHSPVIHQTITHPLKHHRRIYHSSNNRSTILLKKIFIREPFIKVTKHT